MWDFYFLLKFSVFTNHSKFIDLFNVESRLHMENAFNFPQQFFIEKSTTERRHRFIDYKYRTYNKTTDFSAQYRD